MDVFISYAADDDALCAELEQHLVPLRRDGVVRIWNSRQIAAGQDWKEQIDRHLEAARVVVLLVSASYLASDHLYEVEMSRALERERAGTTVVLPILLRPCDWEHAPFARISPLPHARKPVTTWHHRDAAWSAVVRGIRAAAEHLATDRSRPTAAVPIPAARWMEEPALATGRVVGSYVLHDVLGSGGSGTAYRARHGALGSWACVKILYPLSNPGSAGGAMARAIRGLQALDHPNLIRVHDFGRIELAGGQSLFITMDLVTGKPLLDWSRELDERPDALRLRLGLAAMLASAMDAAHGSTYLDELGFEQRGILHGDLKPENILVRPDGSPVILDFMIVDVQRLLDRSLVPPHLHDVYHGPVPEPAGTTADFGTPGYMAPEQADGGVVTVRSDIYSLGITLRWLFDPRGTGPRFLLETSMKLLLLLESMCHVDPARRPENMRSVASALAEIATEVLR